jgi:hypothetical protein
LRGNVRPKQLLLLLLLVSQQIPLKVHPKTEAMLTHVGACHCGTTAVTRRTNPGSWREKLEGDGIIVRVGSRHFQLVHTTVLHGFFSHPILDGMGRLEMRLGRGENDPLLGIVLVFDSFEKAAVFQHNIVHNFVDDSLLVDRIRCINVPIAI